MVSGSEDWDAGCRLWGPLSTAARPGPLSRCDRASLASTPCPVAGNKEAEAGQLGKG